MKHVLAVVVVAVALAGMGAGTGAAYVYGYTQAGEWFSPWEGHGSAYDHVCSRWFENHFSKPSSAPGLVTFINPSGGWSYTRQGNGHIYSTLPASNVNWTKKLHCKNNSSWTYQGGCFGDTRSYPCA